MWIWLTDSVFHENLAKKLNILEDEGFEIFSVVYESQASVLVVYRTHREEKLKKKGTRRGQA